MTPRPLPSTGDELARDDAPARRSSMSAAELYDSYAELVQRVLTRQLGSAALAEDGVQEVLYKVYVALPRAREPARLRSYVVATAVPCQGVADKKSTNTAKIVAAAGGGGDYAAKTCDEHVEDGYDDWFLPAIESFELMKERLFDDGYGNFPGTYSFSYWSSTEIDGQKAYSAHFEADDPAASETFKTSVLSTRPVRKLDQ